ncbi:alpha/beta family hydrolase [Paraglaciecola sp. 2405UD69-4]|uniref:alpha/beta family hydrolase n=1 Tax=Paraglaciecola sp. 2405UD69-4 TaxID=3391836 RepID=UPI0039C9C455
MIETLVNRADNAIATLVFAHGAGAGQTSEFMTQIAEGISGHQINVVRFNFAYMELAVTLNKRRPPEKAEKLIERFSQVLDELDASLPIFIGGKSMGGRIASMLLENSLAQGCICMGYPFHPPGKPEKLRIDHLQHLTKPILILQGERDNFGTKEEVQGYPLSEKVKVNFITDGDHSFKPRVKSGVTLQQNLTKAIQDSVSFIKANRVSLT